MDTIVDTWEIYVSIIRDFNYVTGESINRESCANYPMGESNEMISHLFLVIFARFTKKKN